MRHQDRKLVTAQARGDVCLANPRLELGGQLAEEFVAGKMPNRVVDILEVVEIEQDQRGARLAFLDLAVDPFQFLVEAAPVVQAGQRVMIRQPHVAGFGFHPLGDIESDREYGHIVRILILQPRVYPDHAAPRALLTEQFGFVLQPFTLPRPELGKVLFELLADLRFQYQRPEWAPAQFTRLEPGDLQGQLVGGQNAAGAGLSQDHDLRGIEQSLHEVALSGEFPRLVGYRPRL